MSVTLLDLAQLSATMGSRLGDPSGIFSCTCQSTTVSMGIAHHRAPTIWTNAWTEVEQCFERSGLQSLTTEVKHFASGRLDRDDLLDRNWAGPRTPGGHPARASLPVTNWCIP